MTKRAPSLWLKYDYKDDGDILMQDIFLPSSGLANYTYYCCLNWNSGREGGGYCGFQDHPEGRAYIFSLWDPQQANGIPITTVHKGKGTWTDRFGGEGTGLKSMNFELGWKENQWYTVLVRRWDSPNGSATRFGFWVQDQMDGTWTHLITMEYPVPHVYFTGVTVSFLEDWGFTSENSRCVNYKNGFKRRVDKSWIPFFKADFEVNMYDVKNGTATLNFDATHCNSDEGICIISGGNTQSKVDKCHTFCNPDCLPCPDKTPMRLKELKICENSLCWLIDESSAPQFGYKVTVGDRELCRSEGECTNSVCFADQDFSTDKTQKPLTLELEDIVGNKIIESCK